jgi:hypothetical protein
MFNYPDVKIEINIKYGSSISWTSATMREFVSATRSPKTWWQCAYRQTYAW